MLIYNIIVQIVINNTGSGGLVEIKFEFVVGTYYIMVSCGKHVDFSRVISGQMTLSVLFTSGVIYLFLISAIFTHKEHY